MTEETKPEEKPVSKKEEKVLSTLEQVKAENARLEKLKEDTTAIVEKAERIKAENLLSGQSDAPKPEEKPEPMSNAEYAQKALAGELNDKPEE